MIKRLSILLIFLALVSHYARSDEVIIEVVPVMNRPAAELQPLIEPLLDNGDSAIADGSNLLLKTAPSRLPTLLAFIKKLDTGLSNLMITVLQSTEVSADELNAQIRAQLSSQGRHPGQVYGQFSAEYYQTQKRNAHDNLQTIRTLEGKPAYIKTGAQVPVQNYQAYNSGYGYTGIAQSTEFVEATTGFEVTPRLSGEHVLLGVAPWSDRFDARGQIQTQQVVSTLKVNLGEWVELGASDESSQGSGQRNLARSWQTHDQALRILIKVDRVK
jgi:type II secretory pathway component GspD/PulD (secretin)